MQSELQSTLGSWNPLLAAALPAFIILITLLYDVLSTVDLPKSIQAFIRRIATPFQNFIKLEDLENIGDTIIQPPWKFRSLVVLSLLDSVSWLAGFAYAEFVSDGVYAGWCLIGCVTWLYASWRVVMKPPSTPPYLLLLFYSTQMVVAATDTALIFLFDSKSASAVRLMTNFAQLVLPFFLTWIAGTFPLRSVLPAKNIATPKDRPSDALSNPEDGVTLWSWLNYTFLEGLFGVASMKRLDDSDVWQLSPYFRHRNLFNKYLEYADSHPDHSLLRFLLASNFLDLILDMLLEGWSATVGFLPPYALQQILSSLSSPSPSTLTTACAYALLMFLANMSFAQLALFQNWHERRCYERTRGQLFCALHWKALKRRDVQGRAAHVKDEEEEGSADLGKVVNLMQGDAYAVSQRFWEFSKFFAAPVRLVIALIFLYRILGWSALAGVAIVLVAYVLNYPLAKYNIYITRRSWTARDVRMAIVNELFQNVRFLKFYGWENHWAKKVRDSRETELRWRVKENTVDTLISFIWTWVPSATALTTFMCYTLIAGQKLTVSKAFTSISLFSYLQEPMTALPGQFFAFLRAYVSMQRIEAFLAEGEVSDWASSLKSHNDPSSMDRHAVEDIRFGHGVFEWYTNLSPSTGPSRFQLGPLNIEFPRGKLTLVSGATGSGKSALLAALLGEMNCVSGSVKLNKKGHRVAFCAQNPWLEHATIRDNIIFGSSFGFNEERYNGVIETCALVRDLEILGAGDLTEIGEKGITLSGGQRARIALARAMYSQATCILLDDPLAAVDMHTAQHIVQRCLSGDFAKNRTIILVTHHISLCLPIASYLVELNHGGVLHQGSIQDLQKEGLLHEIVRAEDEVPEDEPDQDQKEEELANEADADNSFGSETEPSKQRASGKLIEAEARAEGRVSLRTYMTYVRAAGSLSWFFTICLMLAIRGINIGNQIFLAKWGEAYNKNQEQATNFLAFRAPSMPWHDLPSPDVDVHPWLMIYLYISLAGAISLVIYIGLGYYASLQASRALFIAMLNRLVRAPGRFFDVTPIGRILNRFTTDINIIDGALQNSARAALSGTLNFVASFLVIVWVVPSFAPFALIIAWLYIRLAPRYVRASRDLRRLESVSLSPAFAGFDELLRGLTHVRAFAMEMRYQERFYEKVDKFQNFDHVYWLVSGWLRWRYDCLGSVVVFLATLFALRRGVSDGMAALVIVQSGIFAESSRQLVRVLAQLELDFNSVERVVEYLGVPQEAPAVIADNRPPAYWPSRGGKLCVEGLVMRYAPELPAVLKDLTFEVRPSEKIAVVGRTGSGKSTLALSLLRMVEASEGRIIVDGIDISNIGLEDLRTRITLVSQDVSLFSGTLRSNLDPFEEHSDQECIEVLNRCHLTSVLCHPGSQLESSESLLNMPFDGSLSAGERQLVALARAVLRRTSIVIMDEATSQIDSRLDDQIQRTIREELSDVMVITIAHRLKTIIDYDRVLVLGDGKILEFDHPKALLRKSNGVFLEMCRKSADWSILQTIAED